MTAFSRTGAARVALAVVLIVAALPAVASATILHTTVTDPASPFRAIDDQSAGGTLGLPATVTVSGSTDSTAPGSDTVDLACTFAGDTRAPLANAVALDPAGAFSATVSLAALSIAGPCVIRALPTGATNFLTWPRFAGPTAIVSEWIATPIASGPNTGRLPTFQFTQVGLSGTSVLTAAGDAGITDAYATAASGEHATSPIASAFRLQQRREFGAGPDSSLHIDGQTGYTTAAAITRVNDQAVGIPALTAIPSLAADGQHLVEGSDVVRCNSESACTAFVSTGVRLERSYALGADGRRQLVSDRYVSTDGLAHDVNIAYEMDGLVNEYGFAIGGSGTFERYSEKVLTFPGGPVSMIGRETEDEPGIGGDAAAGALTWNAPPELRFAGPGGGDYEAVYARQVPAGGEFRLDMALTVGWGMETIRDLVLQYESELTDPGVEITGPAADATTLGDRILVSGIAQGPRALGVLSRPSIVVNGVTAIVAPDGAWTADVPLVVGVNTLTATAINSAGRTGSATRTVTRSAAVPVAAPVTTPPASATPAVRAIGLSAAQTGKPKRTRTHVTFTISGRLQRPGSVAAVSACGGWVRLRVTRAGKFVTSGWAPVRSDCTYLRTFTFKRRPTGTVRVAAQYTGSEHLLPVAASAVNLRLV